MTEKPAWLMTPAELAKLPHPAPPAEPTPQEGEALVERLNGPDGPSLPLNAAEIDYLEVRPPARFTDDVARIRSSLGQEDDGSPWYAGVRAVLDYAEGVLAVGPLTGQSPQSRPPSQGDLGDEVRIAADALSGDLDTPLPHPRDYIVAVEHTAMWLRCTTSEPPVGPSQ